MARLFSQYLVIHFNKNCSKVFQILYKHSKIVKDFSILQYFTKSGHTAFEGYDRKWHHKALTGVRGLPLFSTVNPK